MAYQLITLGGDKGVTGSCHLLQTMGLQIMIDCGLSQGPDPITPMADWPVSPDKIDYLFLTHAHLDHVGRLPELLAAGFKGEILCTHPTKALLGPVLSDAVNFTDLCPKDKKQILAQIDRMSWGFEYGQDFTLGCGISFCFGNAGHILGSSFIHLKSAMPQWSVLFSGDLGTRDTPILPDPDSAPGCNLLVLESTYGDRVHAQRKARIEQLGQVLTRALSDGGKVFIPSFAVGRTQELLYELDRLFSDPAYQRRFAELNRDAKIPVYLDSPMGIHITSVYAKSQAYWDGTSRFLYAGGDHPFDFSHLYAAKTHGEHLKLLDLPGPAVIIAGSGMCTGGRIVNHLQKGLSDPRNDVLMVGYQALGTLGRKLLKFRNRKGASIQINNETVAVDAKIEVMGGYSAHADANGLMSWVASMSKPPERIKLVHGEQRARQQLAEALRLKGYQVQS
jgi:metallo-beta-lactamase family protein